jgi:DNA-binding NarL/FixJ family response regulator
MVRIAIVTDSPVVAAGLRSLLAAETDLAVIDTPHASDQGLLASLGRAAAPEADVLLWAPARGEMADGERLLDSEELGVTPFAPPLVVLLPEMDATTTGEAVRGGASAVLSVDADRAELMAAIRAVAVGLVVLPRTFISELIGPARETSPPDESVGPPAALTQREGEVLALLVEGRANKVIAARLGISEHTVKTHIASVYEKLRARNRAEAVVAAARHGLVML